MSSLPRLLAWIALCASTSLCAQALERDSPFMQSVMRGPVPADDELVIVSEWLKDARAFDEAAKVEQYAASRTMRRILRLPEPATPATLEQAIAANDSPAQRQALRQRLLAGSVSLVPAPQPAGSTPATALAMRNDSSRPIARVRASASTRDHYPVPCALEADPPLAPGAIAALGCRDLYDSGWRARPDRVLLDVSDLTFANGFSVSAEGATFPRRAEQARARIASLPVERLQAPSKAAANASLEMWVLGAAMLASLASGLAGFAIGACIRRFAGKPATVLLVVGAIAPVLLFLAAFSAFGPMRHGINTGSLEGQLSVLFLVAEGFGMLVVAAWLSAWFVAGLGLAALLPRRGRVLA